MVSAVQGILGWSGMGGVNGLVELSAAGGHDQVERKVWEPVPIAMGTHHFPE